MFMARSPIELILQGFNMLTLGPLGNSFIFSRGLICFWSQWEVISVGFVVLPILCRTDIGNARLVVTFGNLSLVKH